MMLTIGLGVTVAPPALADENIPNRAVVSMQDAIALVQGDHASSSMRKAADLSRFRPGNIISDEAFFNSSTMTEAQISEFFKAKVASCRSGYTCLRDYKQNTPNRQADSYCSGYSGSPNESAARIIYKASISCGINPQVLVVMLEKEQSLVTHTWPSQWRYDMALGQGCPDTAPCDPAFSGFFYQIYGAARQMKIYAEGKYFTWYAPGKTWNILYNPNAACGSSPVYIENTATAALYYYTPYQPNAAALRAGYGTGDSCSAYGNRNFYNLFNDWFGSTTTTPSTRPYLIRSDKADPIYLVAGGVRMHVASADDLNTLVAKFGAFSIRPHSEVTAIPSSGTVSRAVRDARDGVIYLLEPDGSKHRFPTADRIVEFGYALSAIANPAPSVIDAFTTGNEVGTLVRAANTSEVFTVNGSAKRHVYDEVALAEILATESSFVATVKSEVIASFTQRATYFGSQRLVRASSKPEVYLTTPTSTLIHVPSLELAALYGATKPVTVVADSSVYSDAKTRTGLKPAVACGDQGRVLDGTTFKTTTVEAAKGLGGTSLTAADCAKFPSPKGSIPGNRIWVTKSGTTDIYYVDGDALRHIWSYNDLLALNGSTTVRTVTWNTTATRAYASGDPLKARENATLRFANDTKVFVMLSGKLRHVASWDALIALAGANPPIDVRPTSQRNQFTYGSAIVADGQFVRFGAGDATYVMRDGVLKHVRSWQTLLSLNAQKVPAVQNLDSALEATFTFGSPILADGLFVRFGAGSEVYLMKDGKLSYIKSFDALLRLAGGSVPLVESISGVAGDFPAGPAIG